MMQRLSLWPLLVMLLLVAACADTPTKNSDPLTPEYDPNAAPEVGKMAPDFVKKDTSGTSVSLKQFRGKVVLIDFWATWCGPCVASLPELQKHWQKFNNRNFMVLSVSLDYDPAEWRSFINAYRIGWVNLLDTESGGSVTQLYNVDAIPMTLLVGRDGKIIAADHYIDNLDSLIEQALK
jgi:peroxiredoxin